MAWSCRLFDTLSGQLGPFVDVPAASWSVTVSDCSLQTTRDKGAGEGEASGLRLPWGAVPGETREARLRAVEPYRRGLVLMWDGAPVVAGAIGCRTDTQEDTSFALVSPLQLLSERLVVPEGSFGAAAGSTTTARTALAGSMRSVACQVIRACTDPKPAGALPIDLPYIGERGSYRAEFKGFDVASVDGKSALESICGLDGGPDLQLRPYISGNMLRWQVVAGSDADPEIRGSVEPVLTCFPGGGTAENVVVAHTRPVMRAYATGAGSDEATLCAMAEDRTLTDRADPWPIAEAVDADPGRRDAKSVASAARARLALERLPTVQLQVDTWPADGGASVVPGRTWPGEYARLHLEGHPALPDGRYRLRIMEMAGDMGGRVTLTFDSVTDPWERRDAML